MSIYIYILQETTTLETMKAEQEKSTNAYTGPYLQRFVKFQLCSVFTKI